MAYPRLSVKIISPFLSRSDEYVFDFTPSHTNLSYVIGRERPKERQMASRDASMLLLNDEIEGWHGGRDEIARALSREHIEIEYSEKDQCFLIMNRGLNKLESARWTMPGRNDQGRHGELARPYTLRIGRKITFRLQLQKDPAIYLEFQFQAFLPSSSVAGNSDDSLPVPDSKVKLPMEWYRRAVERWVDQVMQGIDNGDQRCLHIIGTTGWVRSATPEMTETPLRALYRYLNAYLHETPKGDPDALVLYFNCGEIALEQEDHDGNHDAVEKELWKRMLGCLSDELAIVIETMQETQFVQDLRETVANDLEMLWRKRSQVTLDECRQRFAENLKSLVACNIYPVFVWEAFDEILSLLPDRTFAFINNLSVRLGLSPYFVISTHEGRAVLKERPEDKALIDFMELFEESIVGPLDDEEIVNVILKVTDNWSLSTNQPLLRKFCNKLYTYTSFHPLITHRLLLESRTRITSSLQDMRWDETLDNRAITGAKNEDGSVCKRVWLSLTPAEQSSLRQIVRQGMPRTTTEEIKLLRSKGILTHVTSNAPALPLIWQRFLEHLEAEAGMMAAAVQQGKQSDSAIMQGLYVDAKARVVYIDGLRLEQLRGKALTRTEYDILEYLYKHMGEICTPVDIAQAIRPGMVFNNDEQAMLNSQISRLRKKIGIGYILTHRGRGYELTSRPIQDADED